MKVLTLNTNNRCIATFLDTDVVNIYPDRIEAANVIFSDLNGTTVTLYENVTLPASYEEGRFTYDGTTWSKLPLPGSTTVSMRQARLALLEAGLLANIDAAIAAMPSPDKEAAQIEWEYATELQRDSALLAGIATTLALTSQDVDDLFDAAALK